MERLRRSADCQRLVQRFAMGRGDADDLISLLKTIETTRSIADVLHQSASAVSSPLYNLSQRFSLEDPQTLAVRISSAIDEEGLLQSHRKEEHDSAKYIVAAQDVLEHEGSASDLDDMSSVVRVKTPRRDANEQETDEDSWIMRKMCVIHVQQYKAAL